MRVSLFLFYSAPVGRGTRTASACSFYPGGSSFLHNFAGGDGIVQNTADETIAAVGKIASQGMVETDKEIIDVMLGL